MDNEALSGVDVGTYGYDLTIWLKDFPDALLRAASNPTLADIRSMEVIAGKNSSLSGLEVFQRLEVLHLEGQPLPEGIWLPDLKRFTGPASLAIQNHPGLRSVWAKRFRGERFQATAPLEELRFTQARTMTGVPELAHPGLLQVLRIEGSRQFSLEGIDRFVNLRDLHLQSVGRLSEVPSLNRLTNLDQVWFDRVEVIESAEALLDLRANKLMAVVDRHHLSPETRRMLLTVSAKWRFPPDESLYAPLR